MTRLDDEDRPFLTAAVRYTADLPSDGALTAAVVRFGARYRPPIEYLVVAAAAPAAPALACARALAADHLRADPRDVVVMDGGLGVAGAPASRVARAELAAMAGPCGLAEVHGVESSGPNTPYYGAHASVVYDAEGIGENGPIAATPAVLNAVADASAWPTSIYHSHPSGCGE